jgi:hypothetical protein
LEEHLSKVFPTSFHGEEEEGKGVKREVRLDAPRLKIIDFSIRWRYHR